MVLGGAPARLCAEPLRIVYTAISLMYGPLWVTREAGIFKKYNLDVELLYLSGGTLSTAALVSGGVEITFTGAANVVAANLTGADVVLMGATIDLLPFEVWSLPSIKEPAQLKNTKMGVTRIGSTDRDAGGFEGQEPRRAKHRRRRLDVFDARARSLG